MSIMELKILNIVSLAQLSVTSQLRPMLSTFGDNLKHHFFSKLYKFFHVHEGATADAAIFSKQVVVQSPLETFVDRFMSFFSDLERISRFISRINQVGAMHVPVTVSLQNIAVAFPTEFLSTVETRSAQDDAELPISVR